MSANFLSPSKRPGSRQVSKMGGGRVTYRHLLSAQAMTTSNPLRVIAHCDIDAAYAQFEMVRLGLPDDQPVCVQQWLGLIAVNYPARKFGITRHMNVEEARKKCPHLMAVHVATYKDGDPEPKYWGDEANSSTHKVSLDPYRRESAKILAIFKEMVTEGEVEKASIDEAFLDLTALTVKEILTRHPHLATVPADAPQGLDTPLPPPPPISWAEAGNVFPIRGENDEKDKGKAQSASQEDGDGYDYDVDELGVGVAVNGVSVGGWEDMALCIGAEIMARIRGAVRSKLGYTCSAGIAHNKTLSKLCSAWKKPNAQTILREAAVPAFLNPMEFTKIRNLGGKLGDALAKEYEASTVGDMLLVSLEDMQRRFGEESIWVYNILRGIDPNPVTERTASKSMLASKNIVPSVANRQDGYHWLTVLAAELYVRLRDAREITEGLWPKTIVLGTRQPGEASRSRQATFPFTRNLSTEYISKQAFKLWEEVTEPMTRQGSSKSAQIKYNNLALGFHGLEKLEGGQQGIEGFFAGNASKPSMSHKRERSEASAAGPSTVKKPRQANAGATIDISDDEDNETEVPITNEKTMAWTCPRCQKNLSVTYEGDDAAGEEQLRAVRQEHDDYHFARDLYSEERGSAMPPKPKTGNGGGGGSGSSKKKTTSKKPEGIKAFFAPKSG